MDTWIPVYSVSVVKRSGLEVQWILRTEGETEIKTFLAVIITLGGCSWYSMKNYLISSPSSSKELLSYSKEGDLHRDSPHHLFTSH